MKRFVVASLSVALFMAAAEPVLAQPYQPAGTVGVIVYGVGPDFWQGAPDRVHERMGWLDERLENGVRDGTVTRPEFMRVGEMLLQTREVEAGLLNRDGGQLNPRDSMYMQSRLDNMSRQIHWARSNGVDQPQAHR